MPWWAPLAVAGLGAIAIVAALRSDKIAPPAPARVAPLRAAPAALEIPDGGQPPIGADEAAWIDADDYPAESIRNGEAGRVTIRWLVDADGGVRDCGLVRSSGYPRLDHAACDALRRRGRYRPARDAAGWPIAVTRERRIVWRLPE